MTPFVQAEARAASKKPDPDSPFLHLIANLANASTTLLVDSDGVLVEPCESASGSQPCGNDGTQFKGAYRACVLCLGFSCFVCLGWRLWLHVLCCIVCVWLFHAWLYNNTHTRARTHTYRHFCALPWIHACGHRCNTEPSAELVDALSTALRGVPSNQRQGGVVHRPNRGDHQLDTTHITVAVRVALGWTTWCAVEHPDSNQRRGPVHCGASIPMMPRFRGQEACGASAHVNACCVSWRCPFACGYA